MAISLIAYAKADLRASKSALEDIAVLNQQELDCTFAKSSAIK